MFQIITSLHEPRAKRIVFALIGAPLLALIDQSVSFAVVSWSCTHGNTVVMHLVHFLFLATTVVAAVIAFTEWRRTLHDGSSVQVHFLAALAVATASLSALTIAAMWLPVWMISACIA